MLQPLFRNHASRQTRRTNAGRTRSGSVNISGRGSDGDCAEPPPANNVNAKRQELIPFETGDI
jgi:hypothetical protein